jgi:hypothetical protein
MKRTRESTSKQQRRPPAPPARLILAAVVLVGVGACSSATSTRPVATSGSGGAAAGAPMASGGASPPNTGGGAGATAGGPGGPGGGGLGGVGTGAAASAGATGALASALPPPLGASPTPESAGPAVMRRLTNREYSHLMADLLGDTSDPGAGFPSAPLTDTAFEAPNDVSAEMADAYFSTGDVLVATALANGNLFAQGNLPATCATPATADETSCAAAFITTFGRRAYRRPLDSDEVRDLQALFATARGLGLGFRESLAELAKGLLQSPNFLYHWEIGATDKPPVDATTGLVPLTPWQVGARLAETFWESGPDDALLDAAEAGGLTAPADVAAQLTRMLTDPRAAQGLVGFHAQLLLPAGTKPGSLPKSNPLFTDAVSRSLPEELSRFLTSVYVTGDGTLRTLLTAPYAFVNADLAPLYGVAVPAGSGFTRIDLDATKRAGLLTQLSFLAENADDGQDNPIERGQAIYRNLLCGETPAIDTTVPPALTPPAAGRTTRDEVVALTSSPCATACHSLLDPPGFAFESYDGIGAYRTDEAGTPIDASGTMMTPASASLTFTGAIDLSQQLASSSEVRWCLDRQWFRYMLGRAESGAEQGSLEAAYRSASVADGYSLRALLNAMVTSTSFLARAPSPGESP